MEPIVDQELERRIRHVQIFPNSTLADMLLRGYMARNNILEVVITDGATPDSPIAEYPVEECE